MKNITASVLTFLLFSGNYLFAQCTGGNFGSVLNFSTTTQTFTANGNTYYTFQADSGDRYYFKSQTAPNPGEITILDNNGSSILGYGVNTGTNGISILWKAPYTGIFRALTNMPPCQTSNVTLGMVQYIKLPYIPFPTDSAQWSIRKTINNPFSQNSIQYKMKGDTLINGLTYSKIYSGIELNYFSSLDTLHCFLREEQRNLYVKYPVTSGYDTTDILIYDLNLSKGDTFQVRLLNYSTDSIFDFVLDIISPSAMVNHIRTAYQFIPTNETYNNAWGISCELHFHWVEGMGAFLNLLYLEIPELDCYNNGIEYHLACYWHGGQYLWGGTMCDVNTGIIEIGQGQISIYPNPSTSLINIQFNNANVKRIELINPVGSLVESIEVKNSDKIHIDHNLPAGLYLLKFIKNDHEFFVKKLIIN